MQQLMSLFLVSSTFTLYSLIFTTVNLLTTSTVPIEEFLYVCIITKWMDWWCWRWYYVAVGGTVSAQTASFSQNSWKTRRVELAYTYCQTLLDRLLCKKLTNLIDIDISRIITVKDIDFWACFGFLPAYCSFHKLASHFILQRACQIHANSLQGLQEHD